jgi:hypothetical protein
MKAIQTWEENRDTLKQLRSANDSVLGLVSEHLGPMGMLQFDRDTKLYDMYQAGCMLPDKHEEIQAAILQLFRKEKTITLNPIVDASTWTVPKVPYCPSVKSVTKIPHLDGEVKLAHSAGVFLPDVKWRIRKDMIREKIHILEDQADGKISRIERIIRNTIQVSVLYAPIVARLKYSAIDAVESVPAKYRLAVMARVMKDLDIPDPTDPFAERKHIFPSGRQRAQRERIFVLDHAGNAWTWNCGWYRIGENGTPLDPGKPPLGHLKFRRAIKLATAEQLGLTSFRHTRPYGMWRRGFGRVSHALFGNGELEMTDGLHAIVVFDGGLRQEVVLANLGTIATPSRSRVPSNLNGNKPTGVKKTQIEKKIAQMNTLLEGIL